MQQLRGFFKLIRVINLLFIFIAQYLFRYFILIPVLDFYGLETRLGDIQFFLLSFSTVLIAAAGYVINDYFDVKIDEINKPGRIIIDRSVRRRSAIALHSIFNFFGIMIALILGWKAGTLLLAGFHIISTIILWFYSTHFKRQFIIGNVVVSFLTAMIIVIVPAFDYGAMEIIMPGDPASKTIAGFTIMYAVFAFIISMVREIVKDMEDVKGDADYNCKTIPVVLGLKPAKGIAMAFAVTIIIIVAIVQLAKLREGEAMLVGYAVFFVQLPLVYVIAMLRKADRAKDFSNISGIIKAVMLTGIMSMILISIFDNPEEYFNRKNNEKNHTGISVTQASAAAE